jgi:hypothetical protein
MLLETELLRVDVYRGLFRGDQAVTSLSEALSLGRYEIDDCRRGLPFGGVLLGETCVAVENKEGLEGELASTR